MIWANFKTKRQFQNRRESDLKIETFIIKENFSKGWWHPRSSVKKYLKLKEIKKF